MGSYLTIVNDTPYKWECQLGSDTKAFEILKTITSIIAIVARIAGSVGSIALGLPLSDTKELAGDIGDAGGVIGSIGSVSDFGLRVAKKLSDRLVDKGFYTILPNESHRWGKMSLSLWQQGTCVRTETINATHALVHTLHMRPIFSGSTASSNRNHTMQYWINKDGTETVPVMAEPKKQAN